MTVPAPPPDRLPDGFAVRLAPGTQRRDGGTALLGGSPLRMLRLAPAARTLLVGDRLEVTDARTAALLVALQPHLFGGLWIKERGDTAEDLGELLAPSPVRKLPANIDAERLEGGLDVAATLAASRPVRRAGLLEEARGGLLLVLGGFAMARMVTRTGSEPADIGL